MKAKLSQFKECSCGCNKCISYCEKQPGWFRPKEIPKLCKFLNLSFENVFKKYLIIDYWITEPENIYLLAPVKNFDYLLSSSIAFQQHHNEDMERQNCDRAGGTASWGYAFIHAPCIFLNKKKKCMIYPVRPFECRVVMHKQRIEDKKIRELIVVEWQKDKSLIPILKQRKLL